MSKTKQDWKCLFGYHLWSEWEDNQIVYNERTCENCGAKQASGRDLDFLNRVTKK